MNIFTALCGSLLFTCLSCSAFAELVVEDGYVRGLPPGVDNTSAYMTIRNTDDADLELIGATSPIAGEVTLHTTMNHDGMLHMQHVMSIVVPAHGEVVLETGGMHLMLTKLKQSVVVGAQVELALVFSDGSTSQLSLPVRSVLDE